MKTCPPGTICFESLSLYFIVIIIIMVCWFFYQQNQINSLKKQEYDILYNTNDTHSTVNSTLDNFPFMASSLSFSSCDNDTLFNAYSGPFKNESINVRPPCNNRLMHQPSSPIVGHDIRGAVPINVPTQGIAGSDFRQIGILVSSTNDTLILPLLGRPLITNRDTWQYYTLSERNIKLPVFVNNRNCTNEHGCTSIYDKDIVQVSGYKDNFTVSMYENNSFSYIPIL